MLSRAYKLHKSAEFQRLYSHGNRISNDKFRLFWRQNNYQHSFVGVVVSKKITKKAVARNTMRRRVYEIVRHNYTKINGHYNILLLLKKDINKIKPVELERNIIEVFKKARLIV